MNLYILLPVYNEGSTLQSLLNHIKMKMENHGFAYEIIVYNDGSTDNTLDILSHNKHGIPLKIIGKEQNEGLGFAFSTLLKEVVETSINDDDIVVVLDSDNTHNPEYIYQMVNKIQDGFDVVIASRYLRGSRVVGVAWYRQFLSLGASWLMRIIFQIKGVKDYTCGYRAYSILCLKKAFDRFGDKLVEEKGFACMAEVLIKLRNMNILVAEIPLILRYDQKGGESKMKIARTIKSTLLMLVKSKGIR